MTTSSAAQSCKEEADLFLQNIPNFTRLSEFVHYQTHQGVPQTSQILFFLAAGAKIAWGIWFSSWKFFISVECSHFMRTSVEFSHFMGSSVEISHLILCCRAHNIPDGFLGSGHKKKENRAGLHLFAIGTIWLQDTNYFLPAPCMGQTPGK